ncbi:hypothetical protein [Winogradskyella bathintestinalis]|uniref:DUF2262 domain-containing protein n=1 Tax=Winogradskyella bathintestinalis TaxID=3035208 RepID=A0ABT7ZQI5_9FLAO|nr:hypothetical protein [Winogradskyella bathintestinalis]MDN3491271.1 hypothetical protein [Winogradskyella bathintestinalis]
MNFIQNYIQEFESLSLDGIYSLDKIEYWLLKYGEDYKRIKKEESEHFMHFINGKRIRLPNYIQARIPEEKFLHIYKTLNELTEQHEHEEYFKKEMAIYKNIKNNHQKVREWLAKNEYLGADKYLMFSLDYFGEEDEMENEIHLQVTFLKDKERVLFIDRKDFQYTIEFTNTFNNTYWDLLEELKLDKLN